MKKLTILTVILFIGNLLMGQTEEFDYVGIGITPQYPLHIYENSGQSTSVLIDADSNANPNIYFKSAGVGVANFRYNDSGNDHFQIQVGSSMIPAINLSMNGKVGIGNIEPDNALDVNGSVFINGKIIGNTFTIDLDGGSTSYPKKITSNNVGGTATMEFQTYSSTNDSLQTRILMRGGGSNDIEFYDKDETEFVHFDGDSGTVSIGEVNSDGYKLAVDGEVFINEKIIGNTFTIDLDGGSTSYPKRITSNDVGGTATMEFQTFSSTNDSLQTRILMRGGGSNDIEFYDKDETEFVHFDGDLGTVGIGTTSTFDYKLAVNGSIGAQEITVESTSAWPDYVFSENYKLMDLKKVEEYISENQKLPNIPSDKEVNESGINLGEMNANLLLKIEELTLYMINQDKKTDYLLEKLEILEQENKKLKTKINEREISE